jgi:EmrB/QacA subfamily drug resistance transporter
MTSSERTATQPQRVVVIFTALMLVWFVAGIDQTIVSVALPTIVGDLGGLAHLSWVVTAYLLTLVVTGPIWGKLGDLYGRKRTLQAALVIFLVASALCGLSQNMLELILFRALQGIGGGGLLGTIYAVIGDLVPARERGRYQGILVGTWASATVIAPLVGGFLVDQLSWRWIFYVNLPVGLVALTVIGLTFRVRSATHRPRIDYVGAFLLSGALSAIVLVTSLGGNTWPWGSPQLIALAVLAVLLVPAFFLHERRTAEPIIPPWLWRSRAFVISSIGGAFSFFVIFGTSTYMPLYLQISKGLSPTRSGLQMLPIMAGLTISGIIVGQLVARSGRYRVYPIVGSALVVVGACLLTLIGPGTSMNEVMLILFLLGFGMGMVNPILIVVVQNSVDFSVMGTATSSFSTLRQIGGAFGVTVLGAIFSGRLAGELARRVPVGTHLPRVSSPNAIGALPPKLHAAFENAFSAALHPTFVVSAGMAIASFILLWKLPETPLRTQTRAEAAAASQLDAAAIAEAPVTSS